MNDAAAAGAPSLGAAAVAPGFLVRVAALPLDTLAALRAPETVGWLDRALALLERNNWIKLKSGRDNRSRCASISGLGRKALDRAQPDWARTQLAIVEKFGRDRWAHFVAEMQRLSQYAAELEPGMAKREAK